MMWSQDRLYDVESGSSLRRGVRIVSMTWVLCGQDKEGLADLCTEGLAGTSVTTSARLRERARLRECAREHKRWREREQQKTEGA
eukprot:4989333-Pleurochrysis_carterae.AAC.1